MDGTAVERFVRETLGCGCPDEVFRELRVEPADGLHDGAIHVGGRLLVLLLKGDAAGTRVAPLLVAGRRERDALGYNRVRVVMASDDPEIALAAEAAFMASPARDDRTHFHLVPSAALPSLD